MISPKIGGFDFSYVEKLIELTNVHKAINLIAPHSSFICAPQLMDALAVEITSNLNISAAPFGEPVLIEKIAAKLNRDYGHAYNPETEITITAGVNQVIYAAIAALIREGDQVIVFEPTHSHFVPAIELCGGQPVFVRMKEPGFFIDWEEVQKMITGKTKMILLSSPHNPSGWVMSELDTIRLQRIISGTKIIVLNDETYQHIIFDGEAHQSLSAYPKLAEQSIVTASLSETFRISSMALSYVVAPADITKEIRKVLQMMSHGVSPALQKAIASVCDKKEFYADLPTFYQQKRDLFLSAMEDSKFKVIPPKGACFMVIGINGASSLTDKEFVTELITEHGVAALPMSLFNHEKSKNQYMRIDLTQPDELLLEAAKRLSTI